MSATRWNEHELLRKLLLKILSGNKPLVFDRPQVGRARTPHPGIRCA